MWFSTAHCDRERVMRSMDNVRAETVQIVGIVHSRGCFRQHARSIYFASAPYYIVHAGSRTKALAELVQSLTSHAFRDYRVLSHR